MIDLSSKKRGSPAWHISRTGAYGCPWVLCPSFIAPNVRWKMFEYSLNIVEKKKQQQTTLPVAWGEWKGLFRFKHLFQAFSQRGLVLCSIIVFTEFFRDRILIPQEARGARKRSFWWTWRAYIRLGWAIFCQVRTRQMLLSGCVPSIPLSFSLSSFSLLCENNLSPSFSCPWPQTFSQFSSLHIDRHHP